MAVLNLNALSVALSGSFSATVILPDQPLLEEKKYPALYFLHDVGGGPNDIRETAGLQRLAGELGLFIICPGVMHSFGLDLPWGGKYGDFVRRELPGICRHLFPLDEDRQFVGGTGGGAYGAYRHAAEHPEIFRGCVLLNGRFDVASLCEAAAQGAPVPHLTPANLEAVFGPADQVRGSEADVLRPGAPRPAALYLGCEDTFAALEDSIAFASQKKTDLHLASALPALYAAALRWAAGKSD